jgi:AmiR/NasT family two-component response regulator
VEDGERSLLDLEQEIAKRDAMIAERDHTIEQLGTALDHRTTTAAAVGIVMARYGMDQAGAFKYLRRLSQDANEKLYVIAQRIVKTREAP